MRFDRHRHFGFRNVGIEFTREPISYPTPHYLYTFTLHLWSEFFMVEWER